VEEGIKNYENCIKCHRNGQAEEGEHEGRAMNDQEEGAGRSDGATGGEEGEEDEKSDEHDD